jgi:hypothetical protein
MNVVSPARIVRACLLVQNLVLMPEEPGHSVPIEPIPGDGTTYCYVSSMPDTPDQVVMIKDTMGAYWGRNQRSGQSWVHPGCKLWVRALDENVGFALANAIAVGLDNIPPLSTVVIDGVTHYVQSVYRIGPIISMGEEVGKKRSLWTINLRVAMQDKEPSLG